MTVEKCRMVIKPGIAMGERVPADMGRDSEQDGGQNENKPRKTEKREMTKMYANPAL